MAAFGRGEAGVWDPRKRRRLLHRRAEHTGLTPVPGRAIARIADEINHVTTDVLLEAVPDPALGVEEQAAVTEDAHVLALVDHRPRPVLPGKPQHVELDFEGVEGIVGAAWDAVQPYGDPGSCCPSRRVGDRVKGGDHPLRGHRRRGRGRATVDKPVAMARGV
jgi:hypothetical protein